MKPEDIFNAARYGHLPETFDQWELADNEGWTVAYIAI